MNKVNYQGRVIAGDGFGKKLGFPTANLDRRQWSRQNLKLKHGVYGGTALLPSGKSYKAGIVIGPVDKTGKPKIEAHIINFSGNLYGHKVMLQLSCYIRAYRHFSSIEQLQQQITQDIKQVIKQVKL